VNRRPFFILVTLGLALGTRDLHADKGESAEWAEAAKLLDEGRVLMSKRATLDQGCAVLEKSYALRKRGDTLLNLAECHRRQGKTATAWREFDEAIRYAKEAEYSEAVITAIQYRDQLARMLSELVVEVPAGPNRPPGLEVTLDGEPLPEQQWGQTLYVDPGIHVVTASAPDHRPFSSSAEVGESGTPSKIAVTLVPIPKPAVEPPKPPPPKPPPPSPVPDREVPVWAVVVGGVGVAMMGVSVGFLADSVAAGSKLDGSCGGELRNECEPGEPLKEAKETHAREVRSYGLFVGLGAGGLIAAGVGAAGVVLGLTSDASPVAVLPWADPNGAGAALVGRF
jgi:hypothetical protein